MRTFILNLLDKKLPMWRISILADILPIGYKLHAVEVFDMGKDF